MVGFASCKPAGALLEMQFTSVLHSMFLAAFLIEFFSVFFFCEQTSTTVNA